MRLFGTRGWWISAEGKHSNQYHIEWQWIQFEEEEPYNLYLYPTDTLPIPAWPVSLSRHMNHVTKLMHCTSCRLGRGDGMSHKPYEQFG